MKQTLKYLFPLFLLLPAFAFGQIVKTAALAYTKGASPYTPNIASSSEIRIDTATSQLYWWDRNALTWRIFRPGIDVITGGVAPAYTPRDNQSLFAINADAELWYYDGATWAQIVGAGGTPVNIYTSDGLLKAGGTEVGLDSGSLRLIMATDAAATKYGLEIIASNATSANRFLSGRTESDSFRIQESGGDYFFIISTDLQLNISDQLRVLADSVQYFEGVVQNIDSLPFVMGLTSGGWTKRIAASGNNGKALVSNGSKWIPTTVVTTNDGNGIYSGSGNVPDATTATLLGDFIFDGGDLSSFTVTTGTGTGGEYFQNKTGATALHRDTAGSSSLEFTGTGAEFIFTDGATDRLTITGRDARYGADYSATFSDRSLVDKAYVDNTVAIPESEIVFGNATSDGLTSTPDLTFFENDAMYMIDAGIDMNNGYLDVENSTGNAFLSVSSTDASSTTGGGRVVMRSTDGAANASGDRLGVINFRGQTGVGGVSDGATIESFCSNAWGVGDAPGNLVFSVTPDNSATPANYFLINNNGSIRFHAYGDGTFAGTPAFAAGWDANGNFVEFSATAGGISLGSANQVFGMNAAGTANEYKTINGTTNRITVSHAANSITLSAPQDIHTAATPTFSDLTLTDDLVVNDDISMTGGATQAFTMSGSASNIFQMNGEATVIIGNGTGNADLQFSGSGMDLGFVGESVSYIEQTSKSTSSATIATFPTNPIFIQQQNDGAALDNTHILGGTIWKSRGVSGALGIGAQYLARASQTWTNTARGTQLEFATVANDSTTVRNRLTILNSGQARLNAYGSGIFTGTPAYTLQVTSTGQIIEGTVSAGVTDHGALSGLADDDHSQYLLLAGRSGGQVALGGTGSGDDLTLNSTSNATKGDVFMQTAGGHVLVGGGTVAEETRLSVDNANTSTGGAVIQASANSASTGDASVNLRISGGASWKFGIDNSDADKFKLSQNNTLGTDTYVSIDTLGNHDYSSAGTATGTPAFRWNTTTNTWGNSQSVFSWGENGSEFMTLDGLGNLRLPTGNLTLTSTTPETGTAGMIFHGARRNSTTAGFNFAYGESITTDPGFEIFPVSGTSDNSDILLRITNDASKANVKMRLWGDGSFETGTQTAVTLSNQVSHAAGRFAADGDAQYMRIVMRREITGTSETDLFIDGSSARATIASNTIWTGNITCNGVIRTVGNGTTIVAGDAYSYYEPFTIKNVGGTTSQVVGTLGIGEIFVDASMTGATFTLSADNTNDALKITFTPPTNAGSTTVSRAVCTVEITQTGF